MDEAEILKKELNDLIKNKANYDLILKKSQELDECMNKKIRTEL